MQEVSAGILVYRKNKLTNTIEILLGKNGGPAWSNRNHGAWNIPKGHVEANENLLSAAIREFTEETNLTLPEEKLSNMTYIGFSKTSGNRKVVHIYAVEHDFTPGENVVPIKSNLCETEYPRGSGIIIQVPELSEARYLAIKTAEELIFPYQKVFIERLKNL